MAAQIQEIRSQTILYCRLHPHYLSFQSLTPFRKTAPHLNTGILNPKTCPSCRLQGLSEGLAAMSDIPYPDTPQPDIPAPLLPDFPAPLPEVEPDPGEEPDLPPEPSEPPGDDVPTASGAASPPASAAGGVWRSDEV